MHNLFMHVIKIKTLKAYYEQHPDAEGLLRAWYEFAKRAKWQEPTDVKRDFGDCSILPDNRAVFNIKGNKFRPVLQSVAA